MEKQIETSGGAAVEGDVTLPGDFTGRDVGPQAVVTINGDSFLASQLRMEAELRSIREKLEQFPQMQRDIADLRSSNDKSQYMFQQNDRRHQRHDTWNLLLTIAGLLAYAQLINR